MTSLLCSALNIDSLTLPRVSTSTYSFATNYIGTATGAYGLDRHVMAWLITNPPPMYDAAGIGRFVFVKEDTKPNALKEHLNIHIQLGTEKMYLSFSQHKTTSGTLVPVNRSISADPMEQELTGFRQDQKYFEVRINKCPSMAYARICQSIYRHLMTMYMAFDAQAHTEISRLGVRLPFAQPRVLPLEEREPTLVEKYANVDPVLYTDVSRIYRCSQADHC